MKLKYRIFILGILCLGAFSLMYLTGVYFDKNIPDIIFLRENNEKTLDFNIPFTGVIETGEEEHIKSVNLNESVVLKSGRKGKYNLKIKLFGLIDYKDVDIDVVDDKTIYASGEAIGIYLKSEGVLIIDTGNFQTVTGEESPCKNILYSGDYVVAVNNIAVNNKEELIEKIKNCEGYNLIMTVRRNGIYSDVIVEPKEDITGTYKLGIWVKDDCQGIGTLTYIDDTGTFGALGHGICDSDTGKIFNIEGGILYKANILSIVKGQNGAPGEFIGTIDYADENVLGYIEDNTELGIYGRLKPGTKEKVIPLEFGYMSDASIGPAKILTSIDGVVSEYDIEILDLDYMKKSNKGIVFKVTDSKLLEKTNGIVQGQSGSPIIQNGKLIGAVTHVFVNDSAKGYGIFLESMINYNKD